MGIPDKSKPSVHFCPFHSSDLYIHLNWVSSTVENYWTIMIQLFLTTTGELDVWFALNYDWIRVDMKYSSVVSCRDGMPLKRHWFDKPNKRWWGLIINGGIDDSVWWPWAPSDWMGSLWIMNEEIPDWSVRLSLFQTLSWHFNWDSSTGDSAPTTPWHRPSCAGLIASLLPNKIENKMSAVHLWC